MGNAIIELLVSLALAALAVVIVLGSGAEQLVLQLLVLLFAGFQFGFQRSLFVVVFVFAFVLLFMLALGLRFGLRGHGLFRFGCGRSFFFIFCFVAHCGSSLQICLLALPGHALP